jgi:hypothetical protein
MYIRISDGQVIIDGKTFHESIDNNRLDEHRNQVLSEVLEFLESMEKELSSSLKEIDEVISLPINQYVTEANIYLLRSLIETVGYMKVKT